MRNWKKEMMLFGSIICIYGGSILWEDTQSLQEVWKSGITQLIQDKAEQAYFPGILFEEGETENIHEYITKKALSMVSIGEYVMEKETTGTNVEDEATYEMLMKMQEQDEETEVVEETAQASASNTTADISIESLKNFEYLISRFYTVDSVTYVNESDFNIEEMLAKDLTINKEESGPKVLVFHTHSQEQFADSAGKENGTITDVGTYLTKLLNETYGIETIHHTGTYDLVNGSVDRSQAYERAKPEIRTILEQNPTIEVVIDLHRDGVGANTHLVTEVNGKQTAQIMFFNGMCRTRTNGDLSGMANPYLQENLAFSLQMKIAAEEKYPGFTRRNYLKGYRYNMDLMPKMLLVEAGAQTNTVEEVMNAMEPLAELLNEVLTY